MATDLANMWAKDLDVEECHNPYIEGALRNLIDRLWYTTSLKRSQE
jgi:hypothetical protein